MERLLIFFFFSSAVGCQEMLELMRQELIDNGEPMKVALVYVKDFRRNIFY